VAHVKNSAGVCNAAHLVKYNARVSAEIHCSHKSLIWNSDSIRFNQQAEALFPL